MTRRAPDLLSLSFGLAFMAVAGVVIAGRADVFTGGNTVWAIVLAVVGLNLLLFSADRARRRQ